MRITYLISIDQFLFYLAFPKFVEHVLHSQVNEYFLNLQLDNNDTPINIFLDLSKVYDMRDHEKLLIKIAYNGISDTAFKLFEYYLNCRKRC